MGKAVVSVAGQLWKLCSPRSGETIEVMSNDVPEDAQLESVNYDYWTDTFFLILSSNSIPDVESGDRLPRLQGPVFKVSGKE